MSIQFKNDKIHALINYQRQKRQTDGAYQSFKDEAIDTEGAKMLIRQNSRAFFFGLQEDPIESYLDELDDSNARLETPLSEDLNTTNWIFFLQMLCVAVFFSGVPVSRYFCSSFQVTVSRDGKDKKMVRHYCIDTENLPKNSMGKYLSSQLLVLMAENMRNVVRVANSEGDFNVFQLALMGGKYNAKDFNNFEMLFPKSYYCIDANSKARQMCAADLREISRKLFRKSAPYDFQDFMKTKFFTFKSG